MPRPRKFDTDLAINQVTELFWAHGFETVSIKDIAEKTGLRPGSLHAAFGNKEDMFRVAYHRYGERFRAHMDVRTRGVDGAEAYLKQLATSAVSDPDRKGCLIINTARELNAHTPEIKELSHKRLEDMKSFFRARLAEDGISSNRDCHALFGAAVAILTLARSRESEAVLIDIISAAVAGLRRKDKH
jgi:TetR/AcrR family transcriptional repressor of nem operon